MAIDVGGDSHSSLSGPMSGASLSRRWHYLESVVIYGLRDGGRSGWLSSGKRSDERGDAQGIEDESH